MILIYRFLISLVILLSPIIILIRILRNKEHKKRYKEKFCFFSKKRLNGNLIWIHVASVGEMQSIVPLINRLEKNKNINQILLTTCTLSSANLFTKFNLKKTIHQFFPVDSNHFSRKFLNYWKPGLAIFIESEIWPNMLLNLKKYSINHILLNARLTKKSFKRWKKINQFSKRIFENFNCVYPQNNETCNYLRQLGCKNITQLGNLKFTEKKINIEKGLNSKIIKKRAIWCASSTHYNEEKIIGEIHKNLKKTIKNILTIIIPRHIDRKNKIIEDLNKLNLKVQLHSSKKKLLDKTDVYLVDTYGETKKFFKISKIVFVGGSLVPHGGQNPIEVSRFGVKVIHGKYINNFTEIYSFLEKNNQSKKVKTKSEFNYFVKKALLNRKKIYLFANKLNNMSTQILNKTEKEICKFL